VITFNTQKEFEDAVMAALGVRLRGKVYVHNNKVDNTVKVEMLLTDYDMVDGCISFDWDEE